MTILFTGRRRGGHAPPTDRARQEDLLTSHPGAIRLMTCPVSQTSLRSSAVGLSIPQFGSRGDKDLAITPGLNDRNDESVRILLNAKPVCLRMFCLISLRIGSSLEDIPDLPDDAPGSGRTRGSYYPLLDEGRSIESLIGDLGSDDAMLRERAQETLVAGSRCRGSPCPGPRSCG